MKLSKRLETIASLIPEFVRVIDIGCDHALLDIFLTLQGKNSCIASDINESVLLKTKEMIKRYQLEDQIPVLKSDGLENIDFKKEDMVVIAGMGTSTILHILKNHRPNHLIIDSHTHLKELRKEVSNMGYMIQNEIVVFEKNVYYVIIKLEKGESNYSESELLLGPILINDNSFPTISYFKHLLEKKKEVFKKVPNKESLKEEIGYLEAVLDK